MATRWLGGSAALRLGGSVSARRLGVGLVAFGGYAAWPFVFSCGTLPSLFGNHDDQLYHLDSLMWNRMAWYLLALEQSCRCQHAGGSLCADFSGYSAFGAAISGVLRARTFVFSCGTLPSLCGTPFRWLVVGSAARRLGGSVSARRLECWFGGGSTASDRRRQFAASRLRRLCGGGSAAAARRRRLGGGGSLLTVRRRRLDGDLAAAVRRWLCGRGSTAARWPWLDGGGSAATRRRRIDGGSVAVARRRRRLGRGSAASTRLRVGGGGCGSAALAQRRQLDDG